MSTCSFLEQPPVRVRTQLLAFEKSSPKADGDLGGHVAVATYGYDANAWHRSMNCFEAFLVSLHISTKAWFPLPANKCLFLTSSIWTSACVITIKRNVNYETIPYTGHD